MELIERPNLNAVHFLNAIQYKQFSDDCINEAELNGEKAPTQKDMKTWYSILKQYCKTVIKTKGITKRIYSYSLKTPAGLGGRLFSGGSLQGIWSVYRGLLMRDVGTDIDMENCHPVLLKYICKKHKIICPQLEYYINNREECLSQFETREQGKNAYLSSVNDSKHKKSTTSQLFREFDREMKRIQKQIIELPDYRELFDSISDYQKSRNYNGSAINRILCYYENLVLQSAISVINSKGIEIAILMFDGLMVYGNHYGDVSLLNEIREVVSQQFDGLQMNWTYKKHNDILHIPLDFNPEDVLMDNLQTYEKVKTEFELTHAKIISKGYFISIKDDEIIFMTKQHLHISYEHLAYETIKDGSIVRHNFIKSWFSDPDIKTYDDIGNYPKEHMCPANIFNTWRSFEMDLIDSFEYREDELQFILNHIKILCNNEVPVYEYFISWIAQMVQFPEMKTICPILISKEGAGKGTLLRLFSKMFGEKKVFETTDPAQHVWGDFNGQMVDSFLVNLNEISKKDTVDASGKIKGLITEPKLMINIKGVKPFPIKSYHRFIITTNSEEPVNSKSDDRRSFVIRSSDELIGNKDYFETIYSYLEDVNVIKTCFQYFKTIQGMDKFDKLVIPRTEYHKGIIEESECPIKRWIKEFACDNKTDITMTSEDMLQSFNIWCHNGGIKYSINKIQLGVRIGRMNIDGIEKVRNNNSRMTRFIPSLMKKSLGFGCLVNTLEDDMEE